MLFSTRLIVLGLGAASALALAIGCAETTEENEGATANLDVSGDLVISEVFSRGGERESKWRNDFVELFNRGASPVKLEGKFVQYTGGENDFNKDKNVIKLPPDVTLQPGEHYLIELGTSFRPDAGAPDGGTLVAPEMLPNVDHSETTIGLGQKSGKVAIVTTPLHECGGKARAPEGDAAPVEPSPKCEGWIDFVGYGNASQAEGEGTAVPTSAQKSVQRLASGCAESGNNKADFELADPTPMGTRSPRQAACGDTDSPRPDGGGSDASPAADSGTTNPPMDAGNTDSGSGGGGGADAGPRPDGGRPDAGGGTGGGGGGNNRPDAGRADGGSTGQDGTDDDEVVEDDNDTGDFDRPSDRPSSGSKKTTTNPASGQPRKKAAEEGCSAAPGPISPSSGFGGLGLALAVATVARRRRQK